MLLPHTLDVAIGMALFFLIVSLICSAVREGVETLLNARALDLERGLRELLDDPSGTNMVTSLFDHAQIFSLFVGRYDPSLFHLGWARLLKGPQHLWTYLKARRALPSYIPAGHFASAVMDIVARGPGSWPYPVAPQAMTVEALRERAAYLPSARLQRAVLGAIDLADGDLQKTKANLEAWFNGSMDRVSGWYKRRSQIWLFVIGLAAAVVLNLDTLTVIQKLSSDETLRNAWVAQAESMKELPAAPEMGKLRTQLDTLGAPIGWGQVGLKTDDVAWRPLPQNCPNGTGDKICAVAYWPIFNRAWLTVILGWLITGLAVTFGAPFWFDVLNKFIVIRSTVKPHEKSREQGSKDPGGNQGANPGTIAPAEASKQPTFTTQSVPPAPPMAPQLVPQEAGFQPEEWRDANPMEITL